MAVGALNGDVSTFTRSGVETGGIGPRSKITSGTKTDLFGRAASPSAGALSYQARVMGRLETVVKAISNDSYEGCLYTAGAGGGPGRDLSFKVGKRIGAGFYGVIHAVTIEGASEAARAAAPHLFTAGGRPRTDLVIKLAHNVMLPIPRSMNMWKRGIAEEREQAEAVQAILGGEPIAGSEVLFAACGKTPFLIKPFCPAKSLDVLAKEQPDGLTDAQIASLERDIFDKALRVLAATGRELDIKAQNLAWDEAGQRFAMYEVTLIPKSGGAIFTTHGFDAYRAYVDETIRRSS